MTAVPPSDAGAVHEQGHLAITRSRGQPGRRPRNRHRGGRHLIRRPPLTGLVDRGHPEVIRGPVDQADQHEGSVCSRGVPGGSAEISRRRIVDVVAGNRRAAIRRGRRPRQGHLAVTRSRGQPAGRRRRTHRGGLHRARCLTLTVVVDRGDPEVIRGSVDQAAQHEGRAFSPVGLGVPEIRRSRHVDRVTAGLRTAIRHGRTPRQAHLAVTRGRGQARRAPPAPSPAQSGWPTRCQTS